jgi:hypothetical protein
MSGIKAGLFGKLETIARESYDRMAGLALRDIAVDGCITKDILLAWNRELHARGALLPCLTSCTPWSARSWCKGASRRALASGSVARIGDVW